MPYSESQKKATLKFRDKAYDRIETIVPKGQREVYKAQAASRGLSLNAYIIGLLEADRANLPDGFAVVASEVPETETPSAD